MPVMGDAAESVGDIVAVARKAQERHDVVVGNCFMKKGSNIPRRCSPRVTKLQHPREDHSSGRLWFHILAG